MQRRRTSSSERDDWLRSWHVSSILSGCQPCTNSQWPIIFVMTCSGCQSTWTSGEECIPFHRIVLMSVRTWGLYSNYFTWPNVCIVSFGKWVVFLEGLIFRQACDLCELKTKQNSSFQKQWCNWILSSRPPWSGNSAQNNLTLGVCSQMNELMYLPTLFRGRSKSRNASVCQRCSIGREGTWLAEDSLGDITRGEEEIFFARTIELRWRDHGWYNGLS